MSALDSTSDGFLQELMRRLASVEGLQALVLGGSRARGTAGPHSDYDLGLYYSPQTPLDVAQIRTAVEPLLDNPQDTLITEPDAWGRWINGGAWLRVSGKKVDLLYRDLSRVREVIELCCAGEVSMHYQPGHPHGFCSAIWMGEVALCAPLIDSSSALAELKRVTAPYPQKLQEALVRRFHWEVLFSLENAEVAVARGDTTHISGCVYRALCCVAQVIFAINGRYLINEKGALEEAEKLALSIPLINRTANQIWAAIGALEFERALSLARTISTSLNDIVEKSSTRS